ncbi:hypothetical protein DXC92_13505 [Clostridiales bacterium TF09-2AC]|nr:hypothetical protein DXC92_13505 [Clostridiales bacterium TF09-2AC]
MQIHSRHLHAPLRGIFSPNSVNVARYASLIGTKSPTKWDAQLTESNFQTRPKEPSRPAQDKPRPASRTVYSGHEGKDGGFAVGVLLAGGRRIFDKCSLVWLKTVKWILG